MKRGALRCQGNAGSVAGMDAGMDAGDEAGIRAAVDELLAKKAAPAKS